MHNVRGPPALLIYKKSQLPKEAVVSVLLLIKNQQYFIFIFKKINSSCQLLAGYTRVNTFYRSLLNLQKGLHSVKINSSCQLLAGYTRVNTFYRSLLNLQKGLHSVGQLYDSVSQALNAILEGN